MVRLEEVQARVKASYDRLGMPSWSNPHAGGAMPREEEYSRISQPERYRIVHARGRAWADALRAVPGVEVETLTPAPLDDEEGHRFDRGVRLTSSRPGTVPLLLLERDVPVTGRNASLAVLHISVVRPEISVEIQPDCGCDACDSGSGDLLRAVDQAIGSIVGDPFVALRGNGWYAQWHPDGGSSGGTPQGPDHAMVMEMCRRLADGSDVRLPENTEAVVGRRWLG